MAITINPGDPISISLGATEIGAVDMTGHLDASELVASATVTEVTSSDLTIANVAASTTALAINNRTAAIGKAVQWSVLGQQLNTTYTLLVTATTDSTPARVLPFHCKMVCV